MAGQKQKFKSVSCLLPLEAFTLRKLPFSLGLRMNFPRFFSYYQPHRYLSFLNVDNHKLVPRPPVTLSIVSPWWYVWEFLNYIASFPSRIQNTIPVH